jgi:hypothetical protein
MVLRLLTEDVYFWVMIAQLVKSLVKSLMTAAKIPVGGTGSRLAHCAHTGRGSLT